VLRGFLGGSGTSSSRFAGGSSTNTSSIPARSVSSSSSFEVSAPEVASQLAGGGEGVWWLGDVVLKILLQDEASFSTTTHTISTWGLWSRLLTSLADGTWSTPPQDKA
jgi:hypothetical protein